MGTGKYHKYARVFLWGYPVLIGLAILSWVDDESAQGAVILTLIWHMGWAVLGGLHCLHHSVTGRALSAGHCRPRRQAYFKATCSGISGASSSLAEHRPSYRCDPQAGAQ